MYDTIVIGKGPAGISAAVYLKRAGKNVLVIGKDGGSLEKAELIENYYGFSKALSGAALADEGINQAQRLGILVISEEAVEIEYTGNFKVKTLANEYEGKTLLLATGKKRKTVNIEGVEKFSGSGVSYCAVCDGFFHKGKAVGVIGSGSYALNEAAYLKNFASKVTIFTNGEKTEFDQNNCGCAVIGEKILSIYGNDHAQGIETVSGKFPLSGIFIALGTAGAGEFAAKLGIETENGNIKTDGGKATNIPGIYAAGDCTGGVLQVAKAVSDGAAASYSIIKYLSKLK